MIEQAEECGDIPGKTIIEPTSGNTESICNDRSSQRIFRCYCNEEAVSIERRK